MKKVKSRKRASKKLTRKERQKKALRRLERQYATLRNENSTLSDEALKILLAEQYKKHQKKKKRKKGSLFAKRQQQKKRNPAQEAMRERVQTSGFDEGAKVPGSHIRKIDK